MTDERVRSAAVSIAVINYNGADVLPATLAGIDRVREPDTEVLLVDDGSDDGSPGWAERNHPWIEVIRLAENTRRPNILRTLALERASHRHVFLADNDVVLRPDTLPRLREVLTADPDTACCTPRLVYRSDPGKLYHDGGGLHYLCVSTAVPRGEETADHPPGPVRPTLGGGIMLVDRERALELGGFDEGCLLGWGDDGEFHFRCRIAGYRVLQVSGAVCEHFERRGGERRIVEQLYNRYRLLATGYSGRALVFLAPALLLFELALTVLSVPGGFPRQRIAALGWAVRDGRRLLRRRREVQALRRGPDREVLQGGRIMQPPGLGGSSFFEAASRLVTLCLDLYWRMCRRWV